MAWMAMIGVDLFLHAGLLAPLYDWDSDFLIPAEEAFVRIPAGYLGLAILAGTLVWLLPRLGVANAARGATAAATLGAVVWAALLLGLWSITSATPALLVAWWLGQTAQLAVGGAFVGASVAGTPMRRLALLAAGAVVTGAVVAVILQSIGYAPAPVTFDG